MNESISQRFRRIISLILCVIIVTGMIPLNAVASTQKYPDSFLLAVKDQNKKRIADAQVTYTAYVGEEVIAENITALTDNNGIIRLNEAVQQLTADQIKETPLRIDYEIEKRGYETLFGFEETKMMYHNFQAVVIKKEPVDVIIELEQSGDGDGTVTIDDHQMQKDEPLVLEIIDQKRTVTVFAGLFSYISQITVKENGVSSVYDMDEQSRSEFTFSYLFTKDTKIQVKFESEYRVDVKHNKGGFIFIDKVLQTDQNSLENEKYSYDSFTNVYSETMGKNKGKYRTIDFKAQVYNGYRIKSVVINSVEQELDVYDHFRKKIVVNSDIDIKVQFVKVHTISIEYDPDKGEAEYSVDDSNSTSADGNTAFTVVRGSKVALKVTPNEDYFVSSVSVNNAMTRYQPGEFVNDVPYFNEFEANRSYKFTIEFTKMTYLVKCESNGNGKVLSEGDSSFLANYGSESEITIIPDTGYYIKSIKVNGENIGTENLMSEIVENQDKTDSYRTFYFKLKNITEYKNIFVEFEKMPEVQGLIEWNTNDALRSDGSVFLFKKDAMLGFRSVSDNRYMGLFVCNANGQIQKFHSLRVMPSLSIPVFGEDGINGRMISSIYIDECNSVSDIQGHSLPIYILTDNDAPVFDWSDTFGEISNNIFTSDVSVKYHVFDPKTMSEDKSTGISSGIDSITYKITSSEGVEESGVLYRYAEDDTAVYADDAFISHKVEDEYRGTLTVSAEKFNRSEVQVELTVKDRSGLEGSISKSFVINKSEPLITVRSDGSPVNENAQGGNYNIDRVITVDFDDYNFNKESAYNCIVVNRLKDSLGGELAGPLSESSKKKFVKIDEQNHQAILTFSIGGSYEISIDSGDHRYVSKNGKSSSVSPVTVGEDTEKFIIDKIAPSASIKFNGNVWKDMKEYLKYNIWTNKSVKISAETKDLLSGIQSVLYCKDDSEKALSEEELDSFYQEDRNNAGNKDYIPHFTSEEYEINEDERFTVYVRVTDNAGNVKYISTDGIIYDHSQPELDMNLTVESDVRYSDKPFYPGNVNVSLKVNEIAGENCAYSGICLVSYQIVSDISKDNEIYLYTFDYDKKNNEYTEKKYVDGKLVETKGKYTRDKLCSSYEYEITVDSKRHNCDNICVIAKALDNAGNQVTDTVEFGINSTVPKMSISYDSDNCKKAVGGKGYYSEPRTAIVKVTDRRSTFSEKAPSEYVVIDSVTDVWGNDIREYAAPVISSEWTHNGEEHLFTVRFYEDANYKWHINDYVNRVGSKASVKTSGKTPYSFAVDKTEPLQEDCRIAIEENVWNKIFDVLTFGLFDRLYEKTAVKVEIGGSDSTTPVDIYYFTDTSATSRSGNELLSYLKGLEGNKWTAYEGSELQKKGLKDPDHYVVYVKITNYAGLSQYISSDGYIIDTSASSVSITPKDKNGRPVTEKNYIFNSAYLDDDGINVDIAVDEINETYSGIRLVKYWTEVRSANGEDIVVQPEKVLFEDNRQDRRYSDLKKKLQYTISLDPMMNNYSDLRLYVYTQDNAGNENTSFVSLDIDVTAPKIDVRFVSEKANQAAVDGYYAHRKAFVTITERDRHFSAEKASEAISILSGNYREPLMKNDSSYVINEWQPSVNVEDRDKCSFTAEIDFIADGNYEFDIDYFDMAGNHAETLRYTDDLTGEGVIVSDEPQNFAIDTQSPECYLRESKNVWDMLVETLTFGLWRKQSPEFTLKCTDDVSPIQEIAVYKHSDQNSSEEDAPLSLDELSKLYIDGQFENVEFGERINGREFLLRNLGIEENDMFVLYVRVTDNAGNVRYISSKGMVTDIVPSNIKIFTVSEAINDYYNSSFKIRIAVDETIENAYDVYSGIKNIHYRVVADDKVTADEDLYTFDYNSEAGQTIIYDSSKETKHQIISGEPLKENLLVAWEREIMIPVSEDLNNTKDLKIVVEVCDNSGNTKEHERIIHVNATPPSAEISFDVNDTENRAGYYRHRTATLKVTDRSDTFNEANASAGIKVYRCSLAYKKQTQLDFSDRITWKHNGNEHIATIDFDKIEGRKLKWNDDGNYIWEFDYTNDAGLSVYAGEKNSSDTVSLADGTQTPYKFTVDNTKPHGKIIYHGQSWREVVDDILETLTFGLFSSNTITMRFTGYDKTSPFEMSYMLYDGTDKINVSTIEEKTASGEVKFYPLKGMDFSFSLSKEKDKEQKMTVYLKVVDYAGNYCYIDSDGLVLDFQKPAITIESITRPNKNNIYNTNVKLRLKFNEAGIDEQTYSGLKTASYKVYKDDTLTQNEIFVIGKDYPVTYNELVKEYTTDIVVSAEKNNSSNVRLVVDVTDNAGNTYSETKPLDIDITNPSVMLRYNDGPDNTNPDADTGYFTSRKAVVTITERTKHFKTDDVKFTITAKDGQGRDIEPKYTISAWKTVRGSETDDDKHIAEISYEGDGNYKFGISYTDLADNKSGTPNTDGQTAPYIFTVDKTKPSGSLTVKNLDERNDVSFVSNSDTTDTLMKNFIFKILSKSGVDISAKYSDVTSNIKRVQYYCPSASNAEDLTTVMTKQQLDAVTSWKNFTPFTLDSDIQCMVYLKIMDKAGNYDYISTNAIIIDSTLPIEESVLPQISVNPPQPVNSIYNGDVKVDIEVYDPLAGGTYSGLYKVWYEVYDRDSTSPTVPTQGPVTLYEFGYSDPVQSQLKKRYKGSIDVSSRNNSNNVQLVVYAQDMAGNIVSNENAASRGFTILKIDTTKPKINISYDNNDLEEGRFFSRYRTASVRVTERNFDMSDINITIKSTHGNKPVISDWNLINDGTLNHDNRIYGATIIYSKDDDYEFDISCKDRAGNTGDVPQYSSDTVAAQRFTVDTIKPSVSVEYDKYTANNYYDSIRTAQLTIIEHNFDINRIKIRQSASDQGNPVEIPVISGWTTSGDMHTASIVYEKNAYYEFDIEVTDMAGNVADRISTHKFYVDTQPPVVSIDNIGDRSSNNDNVAPIVSYSDKNLDPNSVIFNLTSAKHGQMNINAMGENTEIENGRQFIFADFAHTEEMDDIYTITIKASDFAGNESSDSKVFSVNRYGSTFKLDEEVNRINGKCVKEVHDIVISEINADELTERNVILYMDHDSVELVENENYEVESQGGNGEWYEYTYRIYESNFEYNANYSLEIKSKDKAENVAVSSNDNKKIDIKFTKDNKEPEIKYQNIEEHQTYSEDNKTVKMRIEEMNLKKVCVYIDGVECRKWEGEDLTNITDNDGVFVFDVPGTSTSAHTIKTVAYDYAGNESTNTIEGIYVTTNFWIAYINNKPLLYGSIAGAIGIVGIVVFIIVLKRKKKNK